MISADVAYTAYVREKMSEMSGRVPSLLALSADTSTNAGWRPTNRGTMLSKARVWFLEKRFGNDHIIAYNPQDAVRSEMRPSDCTEFSPVLTWLVCTCVCWYEVFHKQCTRTKIKTLTGKLLRIKTPSPKKCSGQTIESLWITIWIPNHRWLVNYLFQRQFIPQYPKMAFWFNPWPL